MDYASHGIDALLINHWKEGDSVNQCFSHPWYLQLEMCVVSVNISRLWVKVSTPNSFASVLVLLFPFQEEYVGEDEVGELPCDHHYHAACIEQWLQQKNWCPICKSSALPEHKTGWNHLPSFCKHKLFPVIIPDFLFSSSWILICALELLNLCGTFHMKQLSFPVMNWHI